MAEIIDTLEMIFKYLVELCTTGLELAGIVVLVSTAFICFVKWLRRDRENIRLDLAQFREGQFPGRYHTFYSLFVPEQIGAETGDAVADGSEVLYHIGRRRVGER